MWWSRQNGETFREPVESLLKSLRNGEWCFELKISYTDYYIGRHNEEDIEIASYVTGQLIGDSWMTKSEQKAVSRELMRSAEDYVKKEKARKKAIREEERKHELFKLVKENA